MGNQLRHPPMQQQGVIFYTKGKDIPEEKINGKMLHLN